MVKRSANTEMSDESDAKVQMIDLTSDEQTVQVKNQCAECKKVFKWAQGLKRHIDRIHKKIKFNCSKCSGKFSTKWYLARHRKRCLTKRWELSKNITIECEVKDGQVRTAIVSTKLSKNNGLPKTVVLTCNEMEGLEDLVSNYVKLPITRNTCCGVYRDTLLPPRLKDNKFRFYDHAYMIGSGGTLKILTCKKTGDEYENTGRVELTNEEVLKLKENIKEIYKCCRELE
jgi:hypothetical protein